MPDNKIVINHSEKGDNWSNSFNSKEQSITNLEDVYSLNNKEESNNRRLEEDLSQEEKELTSTLVGKLDRRLMPLLCVLYLLSFIDRSNIGNARLGGLVEDLKMTESEYHWSLSIFYFSYVICNLPSSLVMRRWRASYWLGIIMFLWGAVAVAMAGSTNFAGLAVCRFFLGAFEAGFFPGVIYYMSLWYTRQEYGRRVGLFWSFASLAGVFGGLIAYGISQIHSAVLNTWQLLFIIEGIPSVLLAAFSAWYLPNEPKSARFLSSKERSLVVERLAADAGASNDHTWSWAQVASVFTDWKTYFYMFIYITGSSAAQGVSLFLPSIIANMGTWSKPVAQALTVPPYFISFLSILAVGWASDKFFQRAYFMIAINVFGLTGFLLLMLLPHTNTAGNYAATCMVVIATYSTVGVKVTWFNNNYGGLTRRATASGIIVAIGNIGGVIGGQTYFDPPHYFGGHAISFTFMALQTIAVIILRILLKRENKRRSKLSEEERESEIHKYGGIELVGDRHYSFRYVL